MSSLSSLVTNRCPGSLTSLCDNNVTVMTGQHVQYTHETESDAYQLAVRTGQTWPVCRRSAFVGCLVIGVVPATRHQATEENTHLEQ